MNCDEKRWCGGREGNNPGAGRTTIYLYDKPLLPALCFGQVSLICRMNYMTDDIYQPCSVCCVLDRYKQDGFRACTLI